MTTLIVTTLVFNEMLTSAGINVVKNSNEKESVHSYYTMHFF